MGNNKKETKDPFAEYDKFWDELDKAEEIRNDEDYFKEHSTYKKQTYDKSDQNQINKMFKLMTTGAILFLIIGFILLFAFVGNFTFARLFFVIPSFFMFGLVMFVIISILSKLKNQ